MTNEEIYAECAEIFARAAEYLSEHGWLQYQAGKHGGPRCALGALASAAGTETVNTCETDRQARIVGYGTAANVMSAHLGNFVPCWNDDPERTAEDVILKFKELAHADLAGETQAR